MAKAPRRRRMARARHRRRTARGPSRRRMTRLRSGRLVRREPPTTARPRPPTVLSHPRVIRVPRPTERRRTAIRGRRPTERRRTAIRGRRPTERRARRRMARRRHRRTGSRDTGLPVIRASRKRTAWPSLRSCAAFSVVAGFSRSRVSSWDSSRASRLPNPMAPSPAMVSLWRESLSGPSSSCSGFSGSFSIWHSASEPAFTGPDDAVSPRYGVIIVPFWMLPTRPGSLVRLCDAPLGAAGALTRDNSRG